MYLKASFLVVICSVMLISCSEQNIVEVSNRDIDKAFSELEPRIIMENDGIKLIEANDYPLFSDCSLDFSSDTNTVRYGPNKFEFNLSNYSLGGSTTDEKKKGVRIHSSGQFLYMITNNGVYKESSSSIDYELSRGKNSFLVVPSRSYEMSIKNANSYLAFEFHVNNIDKPAEFKRIEEPGIFICSPYGRYTEGVSDRILLDFFLINTEISEEGNYAELVIDGKTKFKIEDWVPFYIDGLSSGRHSFEMTLRNQSGKKIAGNYTEHGPSYVYLRQVVLD